MTKKIQTTKTMSDGQLSDALLHAAHKMLTGQSVTKRVTSLCRQMTASKDKSPPFCFVDDNCGWLSCPRCRSRIQREFMLKMLPVINAPDHNSTWKSISIIPSFGKTMVGELPKGGVRGFKDQISAAIRKSDPNVRSVMCVDISLERRLGQQEYWQWHVHGVICNLKLSTKKRLSERFSGDKKDGNDRTCYRPVFVTDMPDPVGCLAYMAKPEFFKREQCVDEQGKLKIVKKYITIQQELPFIKALSPFKASQRLFYIAMEAL